MSEDRPKPNFLDSMFDGVEKIVGGLEESKKLSEPYPDEDVIEAEIISSTRKHPNKLIWGVDKEVSTHHLFEDFSTTGICGRYFDANQLTNRKTELDDGNFKCCGGCLRILQSRYQNV